MVEGEDRIAFIPCPPQANNERGAQGHVEAYEVAHVVRLWRSPPMGLVGGTLGA